MNRRVRRKSVAPCFWIGKKAGKIAFVGILPPKGESIDHFIAGLNGSSFISAWNSRKNAVINLSLPEFSYDYSTEMADSLNELGIREAFTDDADFSNMAIPTPETPGLKISKVLHKTHIEVYAKGTKAAAALTSAAKVLGAMKFPVLAIISILAFIICSKKFKNKERMMVLDEIDIELQMVDKYLELAERKEDLVAYKQLITIKRSLERDKQRIQYGMKVSGQRVIPVSDTIAGKSY